MRHRRALRFLLTGTALGLLVGVIAGAAFWKARLGTYRPWAASAGITGAGVALWISRRRAWSDLDVALYLDACLKTRETIASALAVAKDESADPERSELVFGHAIEALEQADPRRAAPRLFERAHVAIPLAAAGIAFFAWLPLPPAPVEAPPPGTERVQLTDVRGLETIEKLGNLDARDPAQKERLEKLAQEAKRLREKLREGLEKRVAQSEIAKLRDAMAAERLSLGDHEERAGFEAALGRLSSERALRDAAKALGERDLKGFDDALERLANEREKQDRELARRAIEEAEELADKAGAKNVAKMLAESREEMKKAEKRAELLRELARGLGDQAQSELDEFDRAPGSESAQKLADALGRALENLSPEERKRLAERLKQQLGNRSLEPGTRDSLRDYAERLSTPEGQQELLEELRRLASEDFEGDEARRQQALEDAERGGAEAEGEISGRPLPIPMAGGGSPSSGGPEGAGKQGSGDPSGQSGPGSGDDTGRGKHDGHTDPVARDGLSARAGGRIDKSVPMAGVAAGRSAGRPGETANVRGTGALGAVGPDELSGIERSEVPEEYREQVGRYFRP